MVLQSWFVRSLFVAMLTFSVAASDALAKRGDRGGGGRGGDGGGRSASRGGGGGGGGGRSFSGGGGGRSFSGGGGGRSFSGGGGGGGRSFSGGGDRSSMSRSFSPSRRESFGGGGGGGRSITRGESSGGPSMSRSFAPQRRESFSGGGGGRSITRGDLGGMSSRSFDRGPSISRGRNSESLSRALENMRRGSSDGNAGRRSRGESQVLGNTFDGGRQGIRPTHRERFESAPSVGRSGNSAMGRAFDRSQLNRTFSNDGSAASARSQRNRRTDPAVGRAAWAEALGNSQAGRGAERRIGEGSDRRATDSANQLGRRGGDGNRRGLGQVGSSASERTGNLSDASRLRSNFRRGRFDQDQLAAGRVTNDQVRDFLSMRNRGEGNRGDRSRIDGNRRRDGEAGDGDRGRNRRGDGIGREGLRRDIGQPDGLVGDGGGRRGDGRGGNRRDGIRGDDGNWRDADGNWRRWRGGEQGKGDHRDWSGRWRDGKRFDVAHRIRDDWRGRKWKDHHDVPFHGDWWKHRGRRHHHHHHHHWGLGGWWNNWGWHGVHFHRPYYWWSWTSAPRLSTWFVYDWATPYYWDYGPGEYIHCYNNVIYVNGQWYQPAPAYYERTIVLAESAPKIAPEAVAEVEWLPLGVFVMSRDGVVDNNLLVQLAVTKDGVIGGTVLNQATGVTFDIAGTVDKNSQRAAWTYVDEAGKKIAMETSVFNLTQPESTALLQKGPDDMQVVQLVRLEEPNAEGQAAAGEAAADVAVAKPAAELPPPAEDAPAVPPAADPAVPIVPELPPAVGP